MDIFDDKEISEEKNLKDDHQFREYIDSGSKGLLFVHEPFREIEDVVAQPDTGDFVKWIKKNNPEIAVETQKYQKHLALRSNDFWLPIVFLASDVTLPIYLNLVANYLYDKAKGLLKGEQNRVHFSAVYEDKTTGTTKNFIFEGSEEALQKAIKKFDVNKFLE
ncbi:MAG: hypothetical protein HY881_13375 [Deltaproteobacteria bacterium]|nr:hypothetical protein [Deltaproteobacteria bacterium]